MIEAEPVAKCTYEAIFVDSWESVSGAERECFLQAARAVLAMLTNYYSVRP